MDDEPVVRPKSVISLQNPVHMLDQSMITTSTTLDGYRITRNLGVVRGITVRSRSVLGNIAGGLQTLFGGQISIYVDLCEKTREEAFQYMMQHAAERGANAIINMRYDANEVMNGVTEVLAYGTAVTVEKI
jgi:uncharacterized protein YbjQ (UPF0145 family)